MKVRTSYVSNSSSSSFVVSADLTDIGIACFALATDQLASVARSLNIPELDPDKEWYVTRFLTYDDELYHRYDKLSEVENYVYMDGQMCGTPYEADPDATPTIVEVCPDVWMYASDVGGILLTYKELISKFNKKAMFLYEVQEDGSIKIFQQS